MQTMNAKTAQELLRPSPLNATDAARLALEAVEALGPHAEGLGRVPLMQLLRRVLREGVDAVQQAEHTVSLKEAAWKSVEARQGRRAATLRDLRHYVRRILRVPGVESLPLRRITSRQCRDILQQAFGKSAHSYRKGRSILHSIFAFGYRQEWCDANPVDRVPAPVAAERPIHPLTLGEVRRLEQAVLLPEHRPMSLSLHLMLYCGIRPMEIQRLCPAEDIDREHKTVLIRSQTGKTGGGRLVPLRKAGRFAQDLRIPSNWAMRWRALRRAAGFDTWVPDVCRHTFATYHACYFRNLPALQLEMGHRDASLLQTRYILPSFHCHASAFWK